MRKHLTITFELNNPSERAQADVLKAFEEAYEDLSYLKATMDVEIRYKDSD